MSDAIKRSVTVVPDGRLCPQEHERLAAPGTSSPQPSRPIDRRTTRIEVKIYPGSGSARSGGPEKILRCLWLISTKYVGDVPERSCPGYLKQTKLAAPKIQMRAESLAATAINACSLRGRCGGFSLMGHGQGQLFLSAYGFAAMTDMRKSIR